MTAPAKLSAERLTHHFECLRDLNGGQIRRELSGHIEAVEAGHQQHAELLARELRVVNHELADARAEIANLKAALDYATYVAPAGLDGDSR